MSLFTNEDICFNCIHAVFHECCKRFCKCKINEDIDCINGWCDFKEIKENETDI